MATINLNLFTGEVSPAVADESFDFDFFALENAPTAEYIPVTLSLETHPVLRDARTGEVIADYDPSKLFGHVIGTPKVHAALKAIGTNWTAVTAG